MRAIRLDPGAFDQIRAQLRATPQVRRLHRLHAVLLVAGGLSCRQAARLLGDSPRSVEYWTNRYVRDKCNGLNDKKHSGRRPRLTADQLDRLRAVLGGSSSDAPAPPGGWDGKSARAYIDRRWGVKLGLRRVQALLASIRRSTGK
ncbi:MAG: helix-turn-helix domain-containing protein [Elusimicrobia bacterium]|nr:helix-turn-helix domain-containing protein [Elusimicrobiota bacterium]